LPSGSPSAAPSVFVSYHSLDSGVCAISVDKKRECLRAAHLMNLKWEGVITSTGMPGGCFAVNEEGTQQVFFNKEGKKGKGCNSAHHCICEEPYGLEKKKCLNPLSTSACEKAARLLDLKWEKYLIYSSSKPRGCFKNNKGKAFFNTKGKRGEQCKKNLPCLCHASGVGVGRTDHVD
jgi:hypothetical protein